MSVQQERNTPGTDYIPQEIYIWLFVRGFPDTTNGYKLAYTIFLQYVCAHFD